MSKFLQRFKKWMIKSSWFAFLWDKRRSTALIVPVPLKFLNLNNWKKNLETHPVSVSAKFVKTVSKRNKVLKDPSLGVDLFLCILSVITTKISAFSGRLFFSVQFVALPECTQHKECRYLFLLADLWLLSTPTKSVETAALGVFPQIKPPEFLVKLLPSILSTSHEFFRFPGLHKGRLARRKGEDVLTWQFLLQRVLYNKMTGKFLVMDAAFKKYVFYTYLCTYYVHIHNLYIYIY